MDDDHITPTCKTCKTSRTTGQFAALNQLRSTPLPPGTSLRLRMAMKLMQFLAFHNRLDAIMCFIAIWWALWVLLVPPQWGPILPALQSMTGDLHPLIPWVLLGSGVSGYITRIQCWERARSITTLIGFTSWGVLTVAHLLAEPMYSPAVACYSFFAIAKLIAYVGHQVGLDVVAQADIARAKEAASG